jgi:uncharacterized protein DUF3306
MTEPENFLQRWSQRKLAKGDEASKREPPTQDDNKNEKAAAPPQDVAAAAPAEDKPFHLSSLPSIESIDANTDVTVFLRPGVPPELSRAALRRAWSADPAIRDFVGLVENGWDFNDPNAMPGFGPITPGEVARLAGQMLGQLPDPEHGEAAEAAKNEALAGRDEQAPAPLPPPSDQAEENVATSEAGDEQRAANAAVQKETDS